MYTSSMFLLYMYMCIVLVIGIVSKGNRKYNALIKTFRDSYNMVACVNV